MDITLVIMAAGMGSRFGGLKQAEPVTPDGKGILDFTVYDAQKAGFNKVVFIVRENMINDFKELIGNRIAKRIPCEYVIQDTTVLPEGRTKPFGTGHAVLCCKDVVKGPFAIVNADDYYGSHAFTELYNHLLTAKKGQYAMLGYLLKNTVSENGTVTRGVCKIENGYLAKINETLNIDKDGNCTFEDKPTKLSMDTLVSMNLWAFTPDFFDILEDKYQYFLKHANLLKDEFYVPVTCGQAIEEKKATVKVYRSEDVWHGITYREDLPDLKQAIKELIEKGYYPGI